MEYCLEVIALFFNTNPLFAFIFIVLLAFVVFPFLTDVIYTFFILRYFEKTNNKDKE